MAVSVYDIGSHMIDGVASKVELLGKFDTYKDAWKYAIKYVTGRYIDTVYYCRTMYDKQKKIVCLDYGSHSHFIRFVGVSEQAYNGDEG